MDTRQSLSHSLPLWDTTIASTLGIEGSISGRAARARAGSALAVIEKRCRWRDSDRRAVQSGAPPWDPTDGAYQPLHVGRSQLLPVRRSGGPGDVLVHEGPAQVVGSGPQGELGPLDPHLDPGDLDVRDVAVQGDACDRVQLEG